MDKHELEPKVSQEETINRTFDRTLACLKKLEADCAESSSGTIDSLCQEAAAAKRELVSTGMEQLIVDCYLGIPAEIKRREAREEIESEDKKASLSQQKINEEIIRQMNIESAEMQIKCTQMVRMLDGHPQQKEIIGAFWQQTKSIFKRYLDGSKQEKSGDTKAEGLFFRLRRGIINLVVVTRLIEQLGLKYEYPTPEEDAEGKIDLFIYGEKNIIAMQLKGDSRMKHLGGGWFEKPNYGRSKQDIRAYEKLRISAKKKEREKQTKVYPLFLVIPSWKISLLNGRFGLASDEEEARDYLKSIIDRVII